MQVSGFLRNQLPPALFGRLHAGLPPDEALQAAFALVNARMETSDARRGRGCRGCGGACGDYGGGQGRGGGGDCRGGGCAPACGFDAYNSGSTAVVGYVDEDGVLTTAWAGDSRAVLGVPLPAAAFSSSHAAPTAAGPPRPASRSSILATPLSPARKSVGDGGSAATSGTLSKGANSTSSSGNMAGPSNSTKVLQSDGTPCCSWRAVELSSDHKPERPDERRRVMLSGGRVSRSVSSSTGNSSGEGLREALYMKVGGE